MANRQRRLFEQGPIKNIESLEDVKAQLYGGRATCIPGSYIFSKPRNQPLNQRPIYGDKGSVSPPFIDTNAGADCYVLSAYHPLNANPTHNQTMRCDIDDYEFYVCHGPDETYRKNELVSRTMTGYFGPAVGSYDGSDEETHLLDFIFVKLSSGLEYLRKENVDLRLRYPMERDWSRIDNLNVFDRDFDDIIGLTAYKSGGTTGLTTGKIVAYNDLEGHCMRFDNQECCGLFVVESLIEGVPFAKGGDSGAPVYGKDADGVYSLIGIVIMTPTQNEFSKIYCLPVSHIKHFCNAHYRDLRPMNELDLTPPENTPGETAEENASIPNTHFSKQFHISYSRKNVITVLPK